MTDVRDRRIAENVTTLMFRMGWKQKDLAAAIHMTKGTLSRKINGVSPWLATEIIDMSEAMFADAADLFGDLPSYDEWEDHRAATMLREGTTQNTPAASDGGALRARRDSNPKPSDP